MKNLHVNILAQFLRSLGESKFLIVGETIDNPQEIRLLQETFETPCPSYFLPRNLMKLPFDIDIDIALIFEYQKNILTKMEEDLQISKNAKKDTHGHLKILPYLEMLQARHLAVQPYISSLIKNKKFKFGIDLGGGPGTVLRLLKWNGTIEQGILVDRNDIIYEVGKSKFLDNFDFLLKGNLLEEKTWSRINEITKNESRIFILSDVLHARGYEDRRKLLKFLTNQKGTKIVREFLGFTELDKFLFDFQLGLSTDGHLLDLSAFEKELSLLETPKNTIGTKILYHNPYYYVVELTNFERTRSTWKRVIQKK